MVVPQALLAARRLLFYAKTDIAIPDETLRGLIGGTDEQLGLSAEMLRAAAGAAGREPESIVLLTRQGTFHRLYRVTFVGGVRAILRVGLLEDCRVPMLLSASLATAAAAGGVPVPQVLAVDVSGRVASRPFELIAEASGVSLAEFDDDEPRIREALSALGAVVARLHGIERSGYGFFDPELPSRGLDERWIDYLQRNLDVHVASCLAAGLIDEAEARACAAAVDAGAEWSVEPRLLHGDLGNHNVFWDKGRVSALIDWEDALAGDPVFDIAFWATFHPERRHQAFLTGYQSVRPLPADFERRFWTYFLRVALSKTVHRLRFGILDRPGRPPASLRIQLALQRLESVP
jgi:Ser/Thr protein kinase RdoA (MazF antagonist)